MPDLFTIGYEGLVQHELLDLLAASRIDLVLDVRAVPLSRKAGLSKSLLGTSLATRAIDYLHDRRLGTPKTGRQAARSGRTSAMAAIFKDHMRTDEAREALSLATTLTKTRRVCLLCFERDPHTCHRSILATMIHATTAQPIRNL